MKAKRILACGLLALAASSAASAATKYVITTTGTWGTAQDGAVLKAGGTVEYSNKGSGIAVARSSSTTFLSAIRAAGYNAAADMTVQWQKPILEPSLMPQITLTSNAVTAGDETFAPLQWNLTAVHAQQAWNAGYDGSGVRVAIVDTGIWDQQVDIAPNLDVAHSKSFVPGFNFNQDVGTFWHGTHVAGIVAAADNGIGTIGIAPGATLIGVKVLHNGSGSFSQVIEGILYAATPIGEGGAGADIINMSLGALFPRGGGNTGAGQLVAAMGRAVNYATSRNVLVVSAAGNDGVDLDHSLSYISVPAQSGSGIAVAATAPIGWAVGYPNGATNFNHPASYTNYGSSAIWVAAPGGDFLYYYTNPTQVCAVPGNNGFGNVYQYCYVFDYVFSSIRGSGGSTTSYAWAAGTSMAAPAASAVAALIKQRFPGISVSDLKTKLAQSAVGKGPYYGKGFVNAYNAVTQ